MHLGGRIVKKKKDIVLLLNHSSFYLYFMQIGIKSISLPFY